MTSAQNRILAHARFARDNEYYSDPREWMRFGLRLTLAHGTWTRAECDHARTVLSRLLALSKA